MSEQIRPGILVLVKRKEWPDYEPGEVLAVNDDLVLVRVPRLGSFSVSREEHRLQDEVYWKWPVGVVPASALEG